LRRGGQPRRPPPWSPLLGDGTAAVGSVSMEGNRRAVAPSTKSVTPQLLRGHAIAGHLHEPDSHRHRCILTSRVPVRSSRMLRWSSPLWGAYTRAEGRGRVLWSTPRPFPAMVLAASRHHTCSPQRARGTPPSWSRSRSCQGQAACGPALEGRPRCGCQDPTPATPARLIEIAVGSNFGILNEFKWKRSQQQNCKNQQYLQLLFWLTFHLLNFEWFKFGIFKFWRLQTSFQNPKWSQTKNYEYPKFWQLQTSQILNFKRMTPSH
jgi:hypothetical protein